MSTGHSDATPYDEGEWERIVAELADEMPAAPAPPEPPEEEFVPPDPGPLPRPDLVGRFAWSGALGGPLLLLGGVVLPGIIGPTLVGAGVIGFVVGFLVLVLRSPNEPEDGWDDGSVV